MTPEQTALSVVSIGTPNLMDVPSRLHQFADDIGAEGTAADLCTIIVTVSEEQGVNVYAFGKVVSLDDTIGKLFKAAHYLSDIDKGGR